MHLSGCVIGVAALSLLLAGNARATEPQFVDQECQVRMTAADPKRKYRWVEDDFLAFLCENRNATAAEISDRIVEYKPRLSNNETIHSVSVGSLRLLVNLQPGKYKEVEEVIARIPAGVSQIEVIAPRSSASVLKSAPGKLVRLKPCPACRDGHYGITQQALQQFSTGEGALLLGRAYPKAMHELIADAAQDGDFYAWNDPAAHAQTGSAESSTCKADVCPDSEPDCWKQKMYRWVEQQLERARSACQQPDGGREALYFVGYSLHAVQDLATHQGRTNCEHAYAAYIDGSNPDEVGPYNQLAQELTQGYLRAVASKLVSFCGNRLLNLPKPHKPQGAAWKRQTLKSGLSVTGMLSYRFDVAHRYEKLLKGEGEAPIRWFQTGVDERKPQPNTVLKCKDIEACSQMMDRLLEIPGKVFETKQSETGSP